MKAVTIQAVSDEERAQAKKDWKDYITALRDRFIDRTAYRRQYQALKNASYYLSQGKSILDLEESMRIGGVNNQGLPKLAISRADYRKVTVNVASWESLNRYVVKMSPDTRGEVPTATFGFKRDLFGPALSKQGFHTALVPIIPARLLPSGNLRGYYLLWEVKEWTPAPPKDPILLRRLGPSSNLFAVLAQWDLSKLERAVMRSAI